MGEISLAHNEAENLLALRRLESRFTAHYCRGAQTYRSTRNFLFRTLLREGLFFKSLSACASDPRRRARSIHDRFPPQGRKNAPVITYSALILKDHSAIPYITVTVALVLCSRTAVVRPPIVPVPE